MLKDNPVAATLAVSDLDRARGFYEQAWDWSRWMRTPAR
jgi:predicted enzyme related to lactoylglutathione lyase